MSGLPLVIKLASLSLVFVACIEITNGLNCYECTELPDEIEKSSGQEFDKTCKNKMALGLTTPCPASSPYCLKVDVTVLGGKSAGFSSCGDEAWNNILGGNDCLPVDEIPGFHFKIQGEPLVTENGTVCICNTDACNPYLPATATQSKESVSTQTPPSEITLNTYNLFIQLPVSKPFFLAFGSSDTKVNSKE